MNEPQPPSGVPLEPLPESGLASGSETVAPLPAETIPVPAPVMLAAVECPGCGAKLRNISAEPGATIRCLNCGTRFVAIPSTPSLAADGTRMPAVVAVAEAEPGDKPNTREPRSAGYWILRLPAMALLAIASVACLSLWVFWAVGTFYYGRLHRFEDFLPVLYFPLMPLLSFYFFAITRSLARNEAATLKTAWKCGLVRESLPIVQGTSLPYLVPLACGPGVLFLAVIVMQTNDSSFGAAPIGPLIALGLMSLGCFLFAFMCDDLRQFLWRQQALAEGCGQSVNHNFRPAAPATPALGLWLAGTLLCFAVMTVFMLLHNFTREYDYYGNREMRQQQMILQLVVIATLCGVAVTAFLLGRNFSRATEAWWNAAASLPDNAPAVFRLRNEADGAVWALRVIVYVLAAAGWILILHNVSVHSNPRGYDLASMLFGTAGATMVYLTMIRLYASVRSWRKAQAQFWRARGNLDRNPEVPYAYRMALWTIIFAGILAVCWFCVVSAPPFRVRTEDFVAMVLASSMLHLPIAWLALMAREFVLTEHAAMQLKDTSLPPENP